MNFFLLLEMFRNYFLSLMRLALRVQSACKAYARSVVEIQPRKGKKCYVGSDNTLCINSGYRDANESQVPFTLRAREASKHCFLGSLLTLVDSPLALVLIAGYFLNAR